MIKKRYFKDGFIGANEGSPALIGRQCADCGKKFFPPTELCPYCSSDNIENVFLSTEATVLVASTTRVAVPPYKPPITLAIVDIDGGIRTIGRVEMSEEVTLNKGDKLELRVGKLYEETEFNKETKRNETIDVIGYYFVPKNQ